MKTTPIWKQFEQRVVDHSQAMGVTAIKIPDKFVRVYHGRPIHLKTSFDFACGVDGVAVFFDCKSTQKESFEFSQVVFHKKTEHQWRALESAYDQGNKAGYLVWFYKMGYYAWISVDLIRSQLDLGIKSVTPTTPGVTIESDTAPLNIRSLLREDIDGEV